MKGIRNGLAGRLSTIRNQTISMPNHASSPDSERVAPCIAFELYSEISDGKSAEIDEITVCRYKAQASKQQRRIAATAP
jgi:hypothetical protein